MTRAIKFVKTHTVRREATRVLKVSQPSLARASMSRRLHFALRKVYCMTDTTGVFKSLYATVLYIVAMLFTWKVWIRKCCGFPDTFSANIILPSFELLYICITITIPLYYLKTPYSKSVEEITLHYIKLRKICQTVTV